MANWKNKIEVKHLFSDEPTVDDIIKCAKVILNGMNKIKKIPERIEEDFEMCKDNFRFMVEIFDEKEITKEYLKDCGIDSELDYFNENLEWLYNIGDEKLDDKFGGDKFIWIG
jgi:dsDNA-specific endonuclease/ATPase MutS2